MTSTHSRKLLFDSLKSRKFRLNPSIAVEASFTPVTGVDRFNLFEDSGQCESLSDQISQKSAPLSFYTLTIVKNNNIKKFIIMGTKTEKFKTGVDKTVKTAGKTATIATAIAALGSAILTVMGNKKN